MSAVPEVLNNTDWALLAEQREGLARAFEDLQDICHIHAEDVGNLLGWIDALIEAAQKDGWPATFLEGGEA